MHVATVEKLAAIDLVIKGKTLSYHLYLHFPCSLFLEIFQPKLCMHCLFPPCPLSALFFCMTVSLKRVNWLARLRDDCIISSNLGLFNIDITIQTILPYH
jgi:hypothetical protein